MSKLKVQALSLVLYIVNIDNTNCFTINSNKDIITHNSLGRWSSKRTRSTSLYMDPYEIQYQKYFQSLNNPIQDDGHEQNPIPKEEQSSYDTTYQENGYTAIQEQEPSYDTTMSYQQSEYAAIQGQQENLYDTTINYQQNEYTMPEQTTMEENYYTPKAQQDPYEYQYQQFFQDVPSPQEEQFITNDATNTITDDISNFHFMKQVETPSILSPEEESILNSKREEDEQEEFLRMVSSEIEVKRLLGQNPYAITDLDFKTIAQRVLDGLEDDTQKINGKVKGQSKLKFQKAPKQVRKTVIVLGTGWGAHAFIKLASTYDLRIVVVSPVNHFVFTPMLASAAVGTIEYRSMTEPIRVTNPFIDNYVEGRAVGIDVDNKVLTVQTTPLSTVTGSFRGIAANDKCRLDPDGEECVLLDDNASRIIELSYDYLLCAVGTCVRSTIVPGAKENCFNLKTSQDSKRLRTAIGEALEYASRPDVKEEYYTTEEDQYDATIERQRRVRFVIVGGGATGVELAGELSDFFHQITRSPDGAFQHLKQDISVILVHGGNELLPQMDKDLRDRALLSMQEQGVQVILNTRLNEVGRDYVKICEKGSDNVETIPVGLTVWAAGNEPVPFVKDLLSQLPESAKGSAGRINVDRWLRCPTHSPESFGSILVLGDVACMEIQSKYDTAPKSLPQTAQVAGQQGAFAARMLNRGYDLQQTPPKLPDDPIDEFSLLRIWLAARGLDEAPQFTFLNLGLLAYVGGGKALNQVAIGEVPIFNYSGEVAFALWRSVYLVKQAATRNQALISFDWLRTEIFGRDITRL